MGLVQDNTFNHWSEKVELQVR